MDAYEDRHGKPIEKGLYVSAFSPGERTYFKIDHNDVQGWFVTSNLNPELIDSLTPELARRLTPLVAGEAEVRGLRDTANWLEEQLKKQET